MLRPECAPIISCTSTLFQHIPKFVSLYNNHIFSRLKKITSLTYLKHFLAMANIYNLSNHNKSATFNCHLNDLSLMPYIYLKTIYSIHTHKQRAHTDTTCNNSCRHNICLI